MKRVHKLTFYHPKLERISHCLPEGFVVGGFIRDRLLGIRKEEVDLDITLPFNPEKVSSCISKELNTNPVKMEREKPVFSFFLPGFRLDISAMEGKSIEEDLLKRDFTINAMAFDVRELFLPFNDDVEIIDPSGGFEDLQKGIVRPVTDEALKADPVRVLRGIRIKVSLDFHYAPSFLDLAREASKLLPSSPVERIREELLKMSKENSFYLCLRDMDLSGALFEVFKELKGIEEIPPSGLHQFDLKEHTLKCVEYLEREVLPSSEEVLGDYSGVLSRELFRGFTEGRCLKFVALYHDVGKPLTVKEVEGKLTFYGHDKVGAEIAREAFLRLSFGKRAARLAEVVIRNHLRPFFLYDLYLKGRLTDRAVYRFLRSCGDYAFHTLLLSIADFSATSDEMRKGVRDFVSFVKQVVAFYRERMENLKPLLSGKEIMEIKGIEAGPLVGRIKEKLLELQVTGKVRSREEAVKFVKGYSYEEGGKS